MARVTAVNRDSFLVRTEAGEMFAEATGKLLYNTESAADLPCVGDWVAVHVLNQATLAIIHAVYPRKTWLRRKAAGRKVEHQMIAANIDTAFIVQACGADFNLRRLERYLAMVYEGRIEPVVLLTKTDLLAPGELARYVGEIEATGIRCPVLPLSNMTGEGHEQLVSRLHARHTHCLIGSSGVGKSTLLNRILGQTVFETREVCEHDGRGRHTTTRRQLVLLPNGALIVDTPGMRELATIGSISGIELSFAECAERAKTCRFSDCTHTSEVGCAVLEALKTGELSEERYQNYLKLMNESAFNQMSYVERRQKDKKFGKMVKSALRQLKKN
ncbi:MAG TPA: ribosome small subunit-dependent GTPase A [Candidatus Ozemobacteraceae bacterium]|nr:ribosome small subunit-dependent GTPase A [Candidatus Ozemobacteraceae bacterium]